MLAIQAYCSATVYFRRGALAHFEKVCSSVVVPIRKTLFMELYARIDDFELLFLSVFSLL